MTYSFSLKDAARNAMCSLMRNGQNARAIIAGISSELIGNEPPIFKRPCGDDLPPLEPPFEGGQCVGVLYDVVTNRSGSEGTTVRGVPRAEVRGPITSITYSPTSPQVGPQGGAAAVTITVVGQTTVVENATLSGQPNETFSLTPEVEREDNNPDLCGDPPPPPPPPIPPDGITGPISITYNDVNNVEITEEGDFTVFAPVTVPIIGSFNTVLAPVRISLPDITFDGTLDLGPDFDFNFGQPSPSTGPGKTTEDPPSVPPEDDNPPEDDDNEQRIIGVIVRSQLGLGLRATELLSESGPNLFVPRIASVFFRVRQDGFTAWDGPYDVKTVNAYVPVPENSNAIAAIANPEPGVTLVATPVYAELPRLDG